jgi:NAD(P)-dependent dehydrogenase (short-subunit alcohol dehydrogenase family)
MLDPAFVARMIESHPIGRLAEPREIASAIEFLLSDKASFCTGTCLAVDGGFTAR